MTAYATAVPSELFSSRFPMRQALSMTVPMPTWDMLLTRCWLAAVLLHNELCVREHALLCFVCVLRRGTLARNIKVAFCRSFHVPSKTAAGGCRRASVRPSSQACRYLETSSGAESLGRPKSVEKSRL